MPTKHTPKQLNYHRKSNVDAAVNTLEHEHDRFWEKKTLAEMTSEEWESLCDGCGQCCLLKFEDEDTGNIAVTRLSCHLLDIGTCKCSNYASRQDYVSDCLKLTAEDVKHLAWLPETCAYRLIAEAKPLPWWHPLISGTKETVHSSGFSVRNFAISETKISPEKAWKFIVRWIEKFDSKE